MAQLLHPTHTAAVSQSHSLLIAHRSSHRTHWPIESDATVTGTVDASGLESSSRLYLVSGSRWLWCCCFYSHRCGVWCGVVGVREYHHTLTAVSRRDMQASQQYPIPSRTYV